MERHVIPNGVVVAVCCANYDGAVDEDGAFGCRAFQVVVLEAFECPVGVAYRVAVQVAYRVDQEEVLQCRFVGIFVDLYLMSNSKHYQSGLAFTMVGTYRLL